MRHSAARSAHRSLNGSYSFTPCTGSRENAAYQHTQGARAPLTGTTLPSGERTSRVVPPASGIGRRLPLGRALCAPPGLPPAVIRDKSNIYKSDRQHQ